LLARGALRRAKSLSQLIDECIDTTLSKR
jgi:hypothetical protein